MSVPDENLPQKNPAQIGCHNNPSTQEKEAWDSKLKFGVHINIE